MGTFKGKRIIPKHDGVWNRKKEYEELKSLLTDSEYTDARESVTTAFYTSPEIIEAI